MSAQTHSPKSELIRFENSSSSQHNTTSACSPLSTLSYDEKVLIKTFSGLKCSALQDANLQLPDAFYRSYPLEASLSTVQTDDRIKAFSAGLEHSSRTPYHRIHKYASGNYSDSSDPRYRRSVTSRNVLTKSRPKKPEKRSAHSYVLARQLREHHTSTAQLSRPVSQAPTANPLHYQNIRHLPCACPGPDVECTCHDEFNKHALALPSCQQITSTAVDGLITAGRINAPSLSVPSLKLVPSPACTFSEDASPNDNDNAHVGHQTLDLSPLPERRNSRRCSTRVSGPNKLIKRHNTKRAAKDTLPFPASALSDLSPVPLSSIDIANAQLDLHAAPVTLSEYLTGGRQVSTKEISDDNPMNETLSSRRPRPFGFPSAYQTWKTRRINIFSSTPSSGPDHNCVSTGTDPLASLDWASVVRSPPPVVFEDGCSDAAKKPISDKPDFIDAKPRTGLELKRGWTIALATMDDEITDEVISEELEKLRRGNQVDSRLHPTVASGRPPKQGDSGRPIHSRAMSTPNMSDAVVHSHVPEKAHTFDVNDSEDAATWRIARSALFCCREIVKTERRYQEELKALIDGETTTPPPALMLKHLPALLHASQVLLQGLIEDPSTWGVSAAFMACENEMEAAMVAWCKVAGQFFQECKSRTWRRKSQSSSGSPRTPSRTRTSSLSTSNDGMAITFPPQTNDKSKEDKVEVHHSSTETESSSENMHVAGEKTLEKSGRTERRLSVRDLAIQPTQRVMRYVMLYRDLLTHTPKTSPSRALVERALQAAQRIADKCNNAQSNTAFLPRRPPTAPGDNTSPFRSLMSS